MRSAYRMIQLTKLSREAWLYEDGLASDSHGADHGWTELWRIKVPSKLKFFLWRLAKHSVPTAALLHHRNMSTSRACCLCGAVDTWRHALVDFTVSRSTWALSSEAILDKMSTCREENAKRWLFVMHEALNQGCVWFKGDARVAKGIPIQLVRVSHFLGLVDV